MKSFDIRAASRDELSEVLHVQRRAFGRVADAFGVDRSALPPLVETLAELEALYDDGTRFFVATAPDGAVVGSVRASCSEGRVEIGRLVVDDGWLRLGIATSLMSTLEASFPDACTFSVFTGADAAEPLGLYAKLGYTAVRTEDLGAFTIVWLEKPGPAAEQPPRSPRPRGIL